LPSVPSRHPLTENALSVQLIVPLTGPIEDFHPLRACALPGAPIKKATKLKVFVASSVTKNF